MRGKIDRGMADQRALALGVDECRSRSPRHAPAPRANRDRQREGEREQAEQARPGFLLRQLVIDFRELVIDPPAEVGPSLGRRALPESGREQAALSLENPRIEQIASRIGQLVPQLLRLHQQRAGDAQLRADLRRLRLESL
jgi:hypothetical protein